MRQFLKNVDQVLKKNVDKRKFFFDIPIYPNELINAFYTSPPTTKFTKEMEHDYFLGFLDVDL